VFKESLTVLEVSDLDTSNKPEFELDYNTLSASVKVGRFDAVSVEVAVSVVCSFVFESSVDIAFFVVVKIEDNEEQKDVAVVTSTVETLSTFDFCCWWRRVR